ncbi:MAG: SusD/RagB family nutrient-binding outer membrane lipoprotein, partial [Muribaculaceae bacterium]|nr:SusD/RagB family nutrient-binding outer membrane lipoprotein [Muribaculaceae bacterium]
MNLKKLLYTASTGMLVATASTSCVHDFEDINVNPNTMLVGELNPYGVFEAMFYGFGKQHQRFAYNYTNELVQFTASSSTNNQIHRYNIDNSTIEGIWNAYAQNGANAVHMIEQAEKKNEPAAKAVGLTLKVLFMSNATDLFGDIPYTEAFKGSEGLVTPVYDSQEDIYRIMFEELEEANNIYQTSPVFAKPSIDHMYGGDMALWRKFNNSLYLRLLMRVSARPELKASEKIAEIFSKPNKYPIISSNSENATIKNSGVDPYYNNFRPINITSQSFRTHYLTNTFINLCVRTGQFSEIDPRLPTMAQMQGNDWIGVQGGATLTEMKEERDDASSLNYKVLVRDDAPVWLLEYSEVKFVQAEAALNGYIDGGESAAHTHYEAAVRASCQKWSEFQPYSTTTPIYPITEARINAFLNGIASWNDA